MYRMFITLTLLTLSLSASAQSETGWDEQWKKVTAVPSSYAIAHSKLVKTHGYCCFIELSNAYGAARTMELWLMRARPQCFPSDNTWINGWEEEAREMEKWAEKRGLKKKIMRRVRELAVTLARLEVHQEYLIGFLDQAEELIYYYDISPAELGVSAEKMLFLNVDFHSRFLPQLPGESAETRPVKSERAFKEGMRCAAAELLK
jgi:hypothetical protein